MVQSVPVAANLLETKLGGFSARRIGESMALPIAPCGILHALNFPTEVTLPLFVGGLLVGGTIFRKTPKGQRPMIWTRAVLQHRFGSNAYTWSHPGHSENDFAEGVAQDEWITRDSPPHVSRMHEASAAAEVSFRSSAAERETPDYPVATESEGVDNGR